MEPARRRSRLRFRLWALMVVTLFCGMAAFLARELAPITRVYGKSNVTLHIKVIDAASRTPIAGAEVGIVDPDPYITNGTVAAKSDVQGNVTLVLPVEFAGERTRYRENVAVDYRYRWLEVSAPGFVLWRTPLSQATGMERDIKIPTPVITLSLTKGMTPKVDLGNWPGVYEHNRGRLEIFPDGRFFATWSHEHVYEKTFGLARVETPYLVLDEFDRPVDADRSRYAPKIVAQRYHRVPWAERVYLIGVGEELKFCNSINIRGVDRITLLDNNYYMRDGDRDHPLHGLPKLPAPWDAHLLPKPLTGRVTKVFFNGSAQIDLGAKDGLLPGMELCLADQGYRPLEVTRVERAFSIVNYADHSYGEISLAEGSIVTSRFVPPKGTWGID